MLRWGFYFVLLVSGAHQSMALSLRTMCFGHSYGTLLPNPRDCNSYYVCQSGPQLAYCDHGLHFDRINRVCNWPQWAGCRLDELEDIPLESVEAETAESNGDLVESQLPIEGIESAEKGVAVEMEAPAETHSNADEAKEAQQEIEEPVVVPGEIPNLPEASDSKQQQASAEDEVIKVPNTQEASESNEPQVIQVPVVVPAEIPGFQVADLKPFPESIQVSVSTSDVVAQNNFKPSADSSLVLLVPVATETQEFENAHEDTSQGSPDHIQVLDPSDVASTAEASNSVVSEPNAAPQGEVVVEKVESPQASEGSGQVIELSVPALPVEVPSSPVSASQGMPHGEVVVEKVESPQASEGSGQVIELSVPALPVEVPSSPVSASQGMPHGEVLVEKVESPQASEGSGQVIELSVPALPVEVPSSPVSASQGMPHGEVVVEKVESPQASEGSGQVIELSVPALPVEVPSSPATVPEIVQQGSVIIEKVESPQSSQDQTQVIILPVPGHPADTSTATVESPVSQLEVAVEKIEGSGNAIEQGRPEFSGPVASKPTTRPAKDHQNLSGSSESEEDRIAESAESSEEIAIKATDSQSSEEEHPLKQTSSSEETVAGKLDTSLDSNSVESAQSSEEGPVQNFQQGSNEAASQSLENPKSSEEHIVQGTAQKEDQVNSHKTPPAPIDVRPIFQNNVEKVESPEAIKQPLPEHNDNVIQLPAGLEPQVSNSGPKHFNLTVSILSVASVQGNNSSNSTIYRPIVGAHNSETGHPIDVMTGYNSKNVQCLHDGLYFLPHPSNCQKYFICAYHHLHMHSCGNNLIWSYKREQCELEYDSRCYSTRTTAEPLPEPETPIKPPSREDSPEEPVSVSNEPTTSTPMPPLRTTKIAEVTPSQGSKIPICPPMRQVYLPSFSDCNKYYICILGEPVLTSCPDSMHWDAKGEFCGRPKDVRCVNR